MTSGTPWWGTLLATFLASAFTLAGTWVATVRLDRRARLSMRSTGREEWFRRLQWAEELSAADRDDRRATGRAILTQLTRSTLATAEDVALINAMSELADIDTLEATATNSILDAIDFVEDTGRNESEEST